MVTKEIVDYVADQLKQGVSKDEIKNALVASGWQAADIDEAVK